MVAWVIQFALVCEGELDFMPEHLVLLLQEWQMLSATIDTLSH